MRAILYNHKHALLGTLKYGVAFIQFQQGIWTELDHAAMQGTRTWKSEARPPIQQEKWMDQISTKSSVHLLHVHIHTRDKIAELYNTDNGMSRGGAPMLPKSD